MDPGRHLVAPSAPVPAPRGRPVRVYLDHNSTTPVRPEVVESIREAFRAEVGNPSSSHGFGREAARLREAAREALAAAADCEPEEVIFTSGGTEADNLVLRGIPQGPTTHVVTVATEHEAVLHTVRALESVGTRVTVLGVDDEGRVDPDEIERALLPETRLVSVMAANNETGVLQPIEAVGRRCRERGVLFHTDAVQLFGKLPFSFRRLPVDLASVSAHKICGPKGIGAALVRRGVRLRPLISGGSQEHRLRPGTENLPGIAGFGKAAELAVDEAAVEGPRLETLRDRLERGILDRVPEARINGRGSPRLPNTSNVSFPGCEGGTLLAALDLEGVAVSTGAACNAGAAAPSHVLLAMGRTPEEAGGSLRFSLGRTTREDEIDFALEALARVLARIT